MSRSVRHLCLVLVTLCAAPGLLRAADQGTQGLRYPSLTPDGKSVAFCYRGDVWFAPVDGKESPRRLTIHEEQDTLCRVSPDGQQVAFSSKRSGNYDVYVMSVTGGEPKQLTFHTGVDIVCDWAPDGKKLLMMSSRDLGRGMLDLYELSLDGGTPRRLTFDGGREGVYSPDGTQVVYVRGANSIYWDNYEGSANYDIYVVGTSGGTPRRVTDTDGNERYPFFSADAKTIYFVAEEKGIANFYSMPADGGQRTQVTKYKEDVQRPDPGWDHKTVVFEMVGRLYTTDLTAPAETPAPLPIRVDSDVRNSGLEVRTITSGGEQVDVSADGQQVAFSLRGDIWVMPAGGGEGRRLTEGPATDEWPRFSPDGSQLAYFSNRNGNSDLFLLDLATGRTAQLTKNAKNDFYHSWSPDGKKLVFTSERSGNRDLWVLDLESQQLAQLTHDQAADDDAVFSPDGTQIAFDSGRDGSQAIYVMQADGSDVRRVSPGAGFFQVPSFSPDGKLICFEGASPATGRSGGLYVISSGGGPAMQITRDGSTARWSPRGDYIYFTAERGHESGVYRVPAPQSVTAGEHVPFIGRVTVDRRQELENLFDEAWLALKQGFYDPKMHGVDWDAMKKKYRPMAIDAENKDEFQNFIRQMLAELGASHLGIGGGESDQVAPPQAATGYLGMDFAQDPLPDGARQVERVVTGSPADKAGFRTGDVVTEIQGKKLEAKTSLVKLLAGTVGKDVKLTFRPRTPAGLEPERTVSVKPLAAPQLQELLYDEWVETCKRRVEEATKTKEGEVAYIHLDAMNPQNLQRFQQAVQAWNQNKKIKGMILDIRNNGGGNIHQQLIEILSAKPLAEVTLRGRGSAMQPALYWDHPVVVLINERSFSDAEVFPYMFRAAHLGKLIGVPTAGGVIGTNDITLSDGSTFRVPRTGFKGLDGTNLEGLGVKPDILVEETSEDRLTGRDPQLMKAIEVIQGEIAEREKEEAKKKKEEEKKAEPAKPAPTPQPENPAAGVMNPLADARPGEWVRYKMVNPDTGDETILKVTVTRVEDGVVHFEKEIEKGAAMLPPLPDKVRQAPILELLPMFGQVKGHAVVDGVVGSERAEILQAQLLWPDGSEIQISFTNAVPGYGLLRTEMGKQVVLEALEWGSPEPTAAEAGAEGPAAKAPEEAPPHPIHDAEVGEWVKLRMVVRGDQSIEMTRKVVDVTDDEVTFEVSVTMMGETREQGRQTRPRSRLLKPLNEEPATYTTDTVRVNGETLDCIVMTYTNGGVEEKVWVCPQIPCTGVVKVERDGNLVLELLEWGR